MVDRVVIERDGDVLLVVSDARGEVARSSSIAGALRHASGLLHSPGTGPRGFVWAAMESMESTERCGDE